MHFLVVRQLYCFEKLEMIIQRFILFVEELGLLRNAGLSLRFLFQ